MARDYTRDQPRVDTLEQALSSALGSRAPTPGGPPLSARTVEEAAGLIAAANGYGGRITLGEAGPDELGLDLSALTAVRSLDTISGLICVEAGATPASIGAALADEGWQLESGHFGAPESPIGAALARGEGLPLVMAVGAILPDGTIFETPLAPRRATGPDPVSLLVGARGKTGIVAWVTLRAQPLLRSPIEVAAVGRAAAMVDAVRLLHRTGGLGVPALIRKAARGQAVVTVRTADSACAARVSAALFAAGKETSIDRDPPPLVRPRRLGWRKILELAKGQSRRGLYIGPTDMHGGYVRLPGDCVSSDALLDHLAGLVDPHTTLRLG